MNRLALLAIAAAAVPIADRAADATALPSPAEVEAAIGHLGPVPVPEANPLTRAKVRLGRRLFADPALSGDGRRSGRPTRRRPSAGRRRA